jgi:hypothetical protein
MLADYGNWAIRQIAASTAPTLGVVLTLAEVPSAHRAGCNALEPLNGPRNVIEGDNGNVHFSSAGNVYTYNPATWPTPPIPVGDEAWGLAWHPVSNTLYMAETSCDPVTTIAGVYAVDVSAATARKVT